MVLHVNCAPNFSLAIFIVNNLMYFLIIINHEQGVEFLGMRLDQKEFWRISLKNDLDIYPLIFLFFVTETNFEYLIFIIRTAA